MNRYCYSTETHYQTENPKKKRRSQKTPITVLKPSQHRCHSYRCRDCCMVRWKWIRRKVFEDEICLVYNRAFWSTLVVKILDNHIDSRSQCSRRKDSECCLFEKSCFFPNSPQIQPNQVNRIGKDEQVSTEGQYAYQDIILHYSRI